MSMKAMEELRDTLCEELEKIARKPEMSAGDLEAVHKLTDTIKNIDKITILEEDGGYSQAGDWEIEGRGRYDRDNSYRGRRRDSRGRYSRDGRDDGGYSRRGGYSRDGGRDRMMDHLEQMMGEASSETERQAIRRCMEQLERE